MISEISDNENSLNKIPILKINAKHRQRNSNYSKNSFSTIKTTDRGRPSIFTDIKFSKEQFSNNRIDNYGNEIKKGSKEHKVCFIDDISNQKIAEVILIESSYLNNGFTECDNFCQCQSCFIF